MKKADKDVNNGQLTRTPPAYLWRQAKVVWRRLVPFLEDNTPVRRIDSGLVEQYASQYEIYRNAYKHIQENGEVQAIYKTLQDQTGKKIGRDFVGYKRNPMTQIYDSAVKNLTKLGAELGLSPKSRSDLLKLNLDDHKDERSISDRMKEFLGE